MKSKIDKYNNRVMLIVFILTCGGIIAMLAVLFYFFY